MSELVTLLDGKEVAAPQRARGRLTFVYDDHGATPARHIRYRSPMPIGAKRARPVRGRGVPLGLLPDNEQVLARWAAKFQVSARNVFALISHVGEDCAGAVQFVTPERLRPYAAARRIGSNGFTNPKSPSACEHCVKITPLAMPRDTGQFSLAGAQPKNGTASAK